MSAELFNDKLAIETRAYVKFRSEQTTLSAREQTIANGDGLVRRRGLPELPTPQTQRRLQNAGILPRE